jgi:voltage-gated potassium channel
MNILENKESIFLSEGMQVFRYPVPASMDGETIATARIRTLTGSTVIALERSEQKEPTILPTPDAVLSQDMTLILIGSPEQEARCREKLH